MKWVLEIFFVVDGWFGLIEKWFANINFVVVRWHNSATVIFFLTFLLCFGYGISFAGFGLGGFTGLDGLIISSLLTSCPAYYSIYALSLLSNHFLFILEYFNHFCIFSWVQQ
jgi:hypothetical protein